jgi:beta-phosphoglucomutase-like phosphatase (HAD superfamily)
MAAERIGVAPSNCVVIEDSLVGLRAAKGAGMKCIITYTESTKEEDFYGEGADAVVADLANIDCNTIFEPLFQGSTDPFAAFKLPPK